LNLIYYRPQDAKKRPSEETMSRACLVAAALAVGVVVGPPAYAQTKVRLGQPQVGTFQFVPLQVGTEAGIFNQHGVDLEIISFGGGPRVQQAIAADSIDLGIGSGPELAFVAKGAPEIGIAAMADAPYSVVLAVPKDSGLKTAEDLKDKTISISSKGSLTDWLGQELSRQMGWGSTGINLAPLGSTAAQAAALRTRQIDGMIVEANAGYKMEEDGSGRVLVQFGERIKVFHIYVFYARKGFAEKSPDAVRAFLAGWFETIGYMRAHRAETIETVRRTAEISQGVATRDYDELMGMFNRTGRFDPKALDVLARSFVEMGALPQAPDMRTLITEQYLPGAK
jgi:ABC-type nitrate/sulfonate/bicarbonate transport system substrate-binding protein